MQQPSTNEPHEATQIQQETTTCCIVGGGPAGAMLALLLARQGIPVMLLEAHMDFNRDFRGDTIHPSTLTVLDEIGLADRLLQIHHTEMHTIRMQMMNGAVIVGDFARLKTKYPYIALIPQVDFLKFITEEAAHYPSFQLVMGAQVDGLLEEHGRVCGVRYRGVDGSCEVRAVLTIGADGRFSRVRKLAGFEPIKTAPPMDVLWFRLSRRPDDAEQPLGRFVDGRILLTLNRYDYWQCGVVIPKGKYQEVRAAGLEQFRQIVAKANPLFADRVEELQEWKQIAVLSVESSRIPRWYRPGLLLIGDAAHVMSPVGGVGINYAIQDAVVAANVLTGKLKYGVAEVRDLAKIQRQREVPTRIIQAFQGLLQRQILAPALNAGREPLSSPLVRFVQRITLVRYITARLIALGIKQVHVRQ